MKRVLYVIITAALFLVACEGSEGPQGPKGDGMNWDVEFFTIYENDWERFTGEGDNEIFYRCVKVPKIFKELNSKDRIFIYDEGSILSYILFNFDTAEETQTLLPYIYNYSDNDYQSVVEVIYFDYNTENVAFYVSYSGTDVNYRPGEMTFRVVMNW